MYNIFFCFLVALALKLTIFYHKNAKSLTFDAFQYPFRYKVFTLLPADLHTRRIAVTELFRRKLHYYWNTTHDSSPINNFNSSMKYSSFPIIVSSPEGSLTVNTPNF